MANKVFICTSPLGLENVDLFGISDTAGGSVVINPDDGNKTFIEVGLINKDWDFTVSILLHETLELLMIRTFAAYRNIGQLYASPSSRLFVLSHDQLDDICDKQAVFVAAALPKLAAAWKKHKKKGKKK